MWSILDQSVLFFVVFHFGYSDCPPPDVPPGVFLDNVGPYANFATVNARCKGKGYIIGPSSIMCVYGSWAPSFFGRCSNGPSSTSKALRGSAGVTLFTLVILFFGKKLIYISNSCPVPAAPEGAHLTSEGPFGMGDMVQAVCNDGGRMIGVSSLSCIFGQWEPPFFGDCSNSKRYSCEVPPAPAGVTLSRQGMVPSDVAVDATCTEDMKVLLGINRITCVLGNWAPHRLGSCVDISELGTVVYNNGDGRVIVNYKNGTTITELSKGRLRIQYSNGGYGIVKVKGYRGIPDSQGSKWSIQNNKIFRNGAPVESSAVSFGTIELTGYTRLPEDHKLPRISTWSGVTVINNILYVNGVPMARRTGPNSSIQVSNSFNSGGFISSSNTFDDITF